MAEQEYDAYVKELGYPPAEAKHLVAYAKGRGVQIRWGAANKAIKAKLNSNYGGAASSQSQSPESSKQPPKQVVKKKQPPKQQASASDSQKYQQALSQLTAQGWDQEAALAALKANKGNLLFAQEALMSAKQDSMREEKAKKEAASEQQDAAQKVPQQEADTEQQEVASESRQEAKTREEEVVPVAEQSDAVAVVSVVSSSKPAVGVSYEEVLINDQILVHQTSYAYDYGTNPASNLLKKKNETRWQSGSEKTPWISFDAYKYEISRIVIHFDGDGDAWAKYKPGIVNLKTSDVAPLYSFAEQQPQQTWKLSRARGAATNWKTDELSVNDQVYGQGFRRYVMLEFADLKEANMYLNRLEFYGRLSQRIADGDEQFDDALDVQAQHEEKTNNDAPRKPQVVHSADTMMGSALDNIWKKEDHFMWMCQMGQNPFLVIDLGNNAVEKVFVKPYVAYVTGLCKILTCDEPEAAGKLLIEDKEFAPKMSAGGTYDLTSFKLAKYLRLEFGDLKMNFFALSSVRLHGDGEFLYQDTRELTLEDVKDSDDDELHEVFWQQEMDKLIKNYTSTVMQVSMIEGGQNPNHKTGDEEWMRLKLEYYHEEFRKYYWYVPLMAYRADTGYEQEMLLKTYELQKEIAEKRSQEFLQNELKWVEREKMLKEKDLTDVWEKEVHERAGETREGHLRLHKEIQKLSIYPKTIKVYETWKEAVLNHPTELSSEHTVQDYQLCITQYGIPFDEEECKQCMNRLADLFDEAMKKKQYKGLVHKFFVYQLSSNWVYTDANVRLEQAGIDIADVIRDEACRGINLLRKSRGGKIDKHDKHYIKFLLCFPNEKRYQEILDQALRVMNMLRKPLDAEYARLQSIQSGVLTMKCPGQHLCDKSLLVPSNGKLTSASHKLLEWDYNTWYKPRTAMFFPLDIEPFVAKWKALGLDVKDPEFKSISRSSPHEPERSFVTSDDLAMEYLNLIAYAVNNGFQTKMEKVFEANRKKLGLPFPTNDADLAVQKGPVKTKARQKIKVDTKYRLDPHPRCMAVGDIVRNGVVCETDAEMVSMFEMICEEFSGSIMRVKNAYDDVKKGDISYGYRAVLINIAYGDESVLPGGYRMVVETQLILNSYYQIRKDMHLGYNIVRSAGEGKSSKSKPYAILARDCAKFGELDI